MDVQSLQDALIQSEDRATSIWIRFLTWLREWLGSPESEDSAWLEDWLNSISIPSGYLEWLFYGTIAALLALSAFVIWREYRAVRARPRIHRQIIWRHGASELPAVPTLERLDNARPEQVPQVAMAIVIDRLRILGLVPARRSFTHRQLLQLLDPVVDEGHMASLTWAAERSAYAGWHADEPAADKIRGYLPRLIADLEKAVL